MRWLKERDDRLKTSPPKSCNQLWAEGHQVFARGPRGKFLLVTVPGMNTLGQVYLTAEWQRTVDD